jgi:hypothetical protein
MTLAILALVLGPSFAVFLGGCVIALTRSFRPQLRTQVRIKQRGRAI